jgi:predicted phosphate transport protein (TIGR00153 family)
MALNFHDLANSFRDFREHAERAEELEHEADDKTHEIIRALNHTFIIPFDREDIYKVSQELDDVVDLMENAISNIFVYGIKTKENALVEFADIIKESSQVLVDMSGCLSELKYTPRLRELKRKMHALESRGDRIFRKTISEFFANGHEPLRVIKWKDILEDLEHVMDKYQEVGDTIEGIIVKFH